MVAQRGTRHARPTRVGGRVFFDTDGGEDLKNGPKKCGTRVYNIVWCVLLLYIYMRETWHF